MLMFAASPAPPKKQFPERIVGGSQASRGEFPIIVQIKVGGGHYCGGSIINSQYIVTAAQ
jgi:trypsin